MKLEEKQKVVIQVFPGKKFGLMIGIYEGLVGILFDSGDYIYVSQ